MKKLIPLLAILACSACDLPSANRPATDPVIAKAIAAVKADKLVKDFLYEPAVREEWNIGVLPTGADLNPLADYYCLVLAENGAVGPTTRVRVVDVRQVAKGVAYRKATLGYMQCETHTAVSP